MKKLLKPIILTLIVMAGLTAGAYYLLTSSSDEISEFGTRRDKEQSDQNDEHAYRYDTDQLAVPLVREGEGKNVMNFDVGDAFTTGNSKTARERIERLKRRQDPTFEQPIIAYDPFGTMPNSYYFYFNSSENTMVKYTITVADEKIPDHIRYVNNGGTNNLTKTHEFTVGGLIPGMTNYIIMELLDGNGSHREDITYKVDVPSDSMPARISYERGKSDWRLINGLFFLFPKNNPGIYIYDNNGTMRGSIATSSSHGNRIYATEGNVIYAVSPNRVIRVNRFGEVDGAAVFSGTAEMLDFAYDGYEYVYALTKDKNRYHIVGTSMNGGKTKKIYSFDKGVVVTSLSSVIGGDIYASASKPMGILRIDGLTSARPRVGMVIGHKADWKKTSVKKKVTDPTATKKPKATDDAEGSSDEEAETEAASEAAVATEPPKQDMPLIGWDMSDTVLNLVNGESNGKTDVLTFSVNKRRLVHAIKLKIDRKKKKAEVLLDKEAEFEGKVTVQWDTSRNHCIIANLDRGMFEERDDMFKVTREFTYSVGLDGLYKYSLEGMCFY